MIQEMLIQPRTIAIIGASNDPVKPGGKLIENLLENWDPKNLFPVNPNEKEILGITCYTSINELPQTDLAVLAIHANECPSCVEYLCKNKQTRSFIIISAGFSETGKQGKVFELALQKSIKKHNLSILGPNCIGLITEKLRIAFTSPLPEISKKGCDFVSASGAFAVYLFEEAIRHGLKFSSIYTVGNSINIGIEEILEFWDLNYIPGQSPLVKLLYTEQIKKPDKFLRHSHSLSSKGCYILAFKAGTSPQGQRASLAHTGALYSSNQHSDALFQKGGIIQVYSRHEFLYAALCFNTQRNKGP